MVNTLSWPVNTCLWNLAQGQVWVNCGSGCPGSFCNGLSITSSQTSLSRIQPSSSMSMDLGLSSAPRGSHTLLGVAAPCWRHLHSLKVRVLGLGCNLCSLSLQLSSPSPGSGMPHVGSVEQFSEDTQGDYVWLQLLAFLARDDGTGPGYLMLAATAGTPRQQVFLAAAAGFPGLGWWNLT